MADILFIKKITYEKGRPAANTKLSDESRIRHIHVRGGNYKYRALRLKEGNFSLDIIY